ncbi:MAG: MaoC family dehydratase [Bacteroidales bacterium]|jgi:acyl dehydratase|nr:MaoC family dehydratase [Bacteroidales bacterium]
MEKLVINSYSEFEKYIGKELGVSDYHKITQEQINLFADATLDHQWIHTNPEKAKTDSPYKTTIAHGYLSLSILPYLWVKVIEVNNLKMLVNYGIEKLKFNQAVLVDDKVRIRAGVHSLVNLRGITKAHIKVRLEIEGNKKPALEGILVFLYHFNGEENESKRNS